jgi:hypothetical protein
LKYFAFLHFFVQLFKDGPCKTLALNELRAGKNRLVLMTAAFFAPAARADIFRATG